MKTEAQIQVERKQLEDQLAALDEAEQALEALTPDQRLAESLHTLGCRYNHTDGCGWEYDSWATWREDDTYNARTRYLQKAREVRALLPEFTDEQIVRVAEALR